MKGIFKIAVITAFVIWALFVIFSNATAQSKTEPYDATQPGTFTGHENCQYPNRETNPPNGCDNSDPACPETIKYGYDCQPLGETTQVEETPTSYNIVTEGK